MNLKIENVFDCHNTVYIEVCINNNEMCLVKDTGKFRYITQCGNGCEVYTIEDSETGIRNLTAEENKEIIDFVGKSVDKLVK